MYNQFLVVCVISMVLWQTAFAFVIKDQQFTIDVTNSTQPVFENVSIAVDAASSAVVIDDEQSVQSVENETSTDETDQKKPNVKQISTSFVQIEKTVEICPDDDDVKSTVENNKEEKESRDPLDDSDDEQDKPRHDKYSPPDEEDEADDPDDDD